MLDGRKHSIDSTEKEISSTSRRERLIYLMGGLMITLFPRMEDTVVNVKQNAANGLQILSVTGSNRKK